MFIVGLVGGATAHFIMPGSDNFGILMIGVLGIPGAFVGGFIARLFGKPRMAPWFTRPGWYCL